MAAESTDTNTLSTMNTEHKYAQHKHLLAIHYNLFRRVRLYTDESEVSIVNRIAPQLDFFLRQYFLVAPHLDRLSGQEDGMDSFQEIIDRQISSVTKDADGRDKGDI